MLKKDGNGKQWGSFDGGDRKQEFGDRTNEGMEFEREDAAMENWSGPDQQLFDFIEASEDEDETSEEVDKVRSAHLCYL